MLVDYNKVEEFNKLNRYFYIASMKEEISEYEQDELMCNLDLLWYELNEKEMELVNIESAKLIAEFRELE